MNFPIDYDTHYIFGKYLASIQTYRNGAIEISIDDYGIKYRHTFHFHTLASALRQTRKDIRYLENISD